MPQAIGAIVNMGFEGYSQYRSGNLNIGRQVMAGATGALSGFGSSLVAAMFFGASANMLNTAYQQTDGLCHSIQYEADIQKRTISGKGEA